MNIFFITFLSIDLDVTEAGIVGKVLLANADALCAAAVPLMDPDETLMYVWYICMEIHY